MLRVDHAGEYGAIRIYRAQIAVARRRCPELRPFLEETLAHEGDHLRRFEALMQARGVRPCRTLWFWSWGGAALGLATGLFGRQSVLVCTEAVERAVHRHMEEQVAFLREADPAAAEVIDDIQTQELGHLGFAMDNRGRLRPIDRLLTGVVSATTHLLILLSTQGASVGLSAALRVPGKGR